jgi:phosphotriesterase-related protein
VVEWERNLVADHVNTVAGKMAVADLGRTLVHEHVLIGFPGWFMDARQAPFKREEAMKRVVDAFQELHDHGVRTVIDPCPMDLGRDVEFTAEVSQRSGINLICATGVYVEDMGIPWTMNQLPVEAIAEAFIKEIEDGVAATGIRCGVIKIATGDGAVSAYERKVITAAARAAKATGVPLISHTEKCTCGHDQIDIATGEGLPPTSLIVGHSDGTEDLAYQTSLAKRGVYVGFDRFGLEMGAVPDAVRIKNLKALVDAGYRDQMMVSHDNVACWLGAYGAQDPLELNKIMPNWKMTHLFENIFPELKKLGMTDADIDVIVCDNPRRYFEQASAS